METFITDETKCPKCEYKIDACSNLEANSRPRPGDFSICANCRTWLRFNDDMSLRIFELNDVEDLSFKQILLMKNTEELLEKHWNEGNRPKQGSS